MSDSENSPPEKRRMGCGCMLAAIAVVILVPIVGFVAWRIQAAGRVEKELARIRAAGQPTTPEELETYYARPDEDEDTTALWLAGVEPLIGPLFVSKSKGLPSVGNGQKPPTSLAVEWPDLPAVRQLLSDFHESLDKFHEAAAKGGRAHYSIQFQLGINATLEHAQDLRSGARILQLETLVRARDGDAHGAANSIHAILMMSRSLEDEPLLISQLVRIAIHSIGVHMIEELLPQVDFSVEDLQMLQADLRAPQWRKGLQQSLAGERVLGIHTFRHPPANNDFKVPTLVLNNDDLLFYMQTLQVLIDAADESWPQALQKQDQVEQKIRQVMGGSPVTRIRHVFTGLMLPATNAAIQAFMRANANALTADTAIALELFRRKHGDLPQTLDGLVPEFLPQAPLDPYDGQPLRYRRLDGGFVVYSIGADGLDSGGQPQTLPNNEITFTVQRPLPAEAKK